MDIGKVIDGKAVAKAFCVALKEQVESLPSVPGLKAILVGNNPASELYVQNKQRVAKSIGIFAETIRLSGDITQEKLITVIDELNADRNVHGILVQLPLPQHIDSAVVIERIHPSKDVDGFHPLNVGKTVLGIKGAIYPCTPHGCIHLIKERVKKLRGLNAVVLGRSNIVGKPMAQLLLNEDCTVSTLHSHSTDLESYCRMADILVSAVGKPNLVRGAWIKSGAIVIDVGINLIDGKFVGDVAFDEVIGIASAVTPVPGGVGPMTIAYLMSNTIKSFLALNGIN